jgi:hypothetical protein
MRDNVDKALKRGEKLSELDKRAGMLFQRDFDLK